MAHKSNKIIDYERTNIIRTGRHPRLRYDFASFLVLLVSTLVVFYSAIMIPSNEPHRLFYSSYEPTMLVVRATVFLFSVSVVFTLVCTNMSRLWVVFLAVPVFLFQAGWLAIGLLRLWAQSSGGLFNPN